MKESELRVESAEFMELFCQAVQCAELSDIMADEWSKSREFLANLSRTFKGAAADAAGRSHASV